MANYIQDFLYTELPEGLIPDVIQWFRVSSTKDLPTPSAMYLMMAALTDDGVGYLCIEDNGSYRWVNLVDDNIAAIVESLKQQLNALSKVVTSEGTDIDNLQKETKELSDAIKALEDVALKKFALKVDFDSEVGRLDSEIDKISEDVDKLLALQDRVNDLSQRVMRLETKLDKYPDMPEYDPEANYFVLVFDSETHLPEWCPNFFPPLR